MDEKRNIDNFLNYSKEHIKELDLGIIKDAYDYAKNAHNGQKR